MMISYQIQPGDTLSSIASRYGLVVDELLGNNARITDPDRIYAGQIILIPTGSGLDSEGSTQPNTYPQPDWYRLAVQEKERDVRERAGSAHHPRILTYLRTTTLDQWSASRDETPWCSAFVNFCIETSGLVGTRSAMARSWSTWGSELKEPCVGCIVVLSRTSDPSAGHVGFYVDEDAETVSLLGGNQNDCVCVSAYPKSRIVALRWSLVS